MTESLLLHSGNRLAIITDRVRYAYNTASDWGLLRSEFDVVYRPDQLRGRHDFPYIVLSYKHGGSIHTDWGELLHLLRTRETRMVSRPEIEAFVKRREEVHSMLANLGQRARRSNPDDTR